MRSTMPKGQRGKKPRKRVRMTHIHVHIARSLARSKPSGNKSEGAKQSRKPQQGAREEKPGNQS